MSPLTTTTATTHLSGKLGACLRRAAEQGWTPGRPRHVDRDTLAIDREATAEMICPACGSAMLRGLPLRPVNRRAEGYRYLAFCCTCAHTEEF